MGSLEMTRTSAYKRSLKGTSPKKRKQRRQLRVMQCRSSAGPCRDLPESSCALVIRDTLLCTSWPPGLCPLARATGLCMALLTIFLFSVCLCFVVSNLRDAIWVAFSINVYCLSAGSVVTWPVPLSAALSTEARCHQAYAFLVVHMSDRGFAAYATLAPGLCLFWLRSLKRLVLTFKLKWERNLQACAVWAAFSFTLSTALFTV